MGGPWTTKWPMQLFKESTERSFRENKIFSIKCIFYRFYVFLSFSTVGITAFGFEYNAVTHSMLAAS